MIDPKLNELPVPQSPAKAKVPENESTERSRTPREGLSINETVAGDTLLSSGVPGVDTSGVRAGAGSAAGSSSLTPGTGASPAPKVVAGARQTGTTVAGSNPSGTGPIGQAHTGVPGTGHTEAEGTRTSDDLSHDQVSARAYDCWVQRGCPHGDPEVDWRLAQEQLRAERNRGKHATAATS